MTQFSNATFSVGGRHCDGCSQRDVWLEQKDEEIAELKRSVAWFKQKFCEDKDFYAMPSNRGL